MNRPRQLPLIFAPSCPCGACSLWAGLGSWLVGEAPEPMWLSVAIVADRHRAKVNAASGVLR
jgi:hypothetical protein